MNTRLMPLIMLAASFVLAPAASAQNLDNLKEQAGSALSGGSSSSGGSLLSALGSGSFSLGSMQNVAGVLGYCQQQGYAASATDRVKEQLMGRFGGQEDASRSSDYQQGLSGVLEGDSGKTFSLSNLKDQAGEKVCSTVADRAASSFLGG